MTTIYHDPDGDLSVIDGESVAVVGYGNQGRSWAMNLRDSGFDVRVCVRADASRDQAAADGFEPGNLEDASDVEIVCVLVPDDVIPSLPFTRPDGSDLVPERAIVPAGSSYQERRRQNLRQMSRSQKIAAAVARKVIAAVMNAP